MEWVHDAIVFSIRAGPFVGLGIGVLLGRNFRAGVAGLLAGFLFSMLTLAATMVAKL